ncbi:XRE family transcriptional regulator [Arthrobacter sp. ERGS1:01]|uniref:helix-turn-helix domain-containing protein n=1 Tax=Arthrobacter sp. ERGS1:01 TaxID=1704044 RepID=UPI0006B4BE31|nr:helix-turn-helix transcriptional regulator [Arthrobacter sp. ERGS1:01]ALE04988.1 XRE family transcriptional regulator [Arthrobacter sp. ERGS1:01]
MAPAQPSEEQLIHCRLDRLLEQRNMTLTDLSRAVGVTLANLSVLKNDRAKAIRFSTLAAICEVLKCEVGELLVVDAVAPPGSTMDATATGKARD